MLNTSNIEEMIVHLCAPCFAGIKPSNLFSVRDEDEHLIHSLDFEILNKNGFYIKTLCRCKKHVQFFLYRKKALESLLLQNTVSNALSYFGYNRADSIDKKLDILSSKMTDMQTGCIKERNKCFPHEIGIFLGYPVDDVLEYCKKKGSGCVFSGYWKVYFNVGKAAEIFRLYDECKKRAALQIQKGQKLYDLLSA